MISCDKLRSRAWAKSIISRCSQRRGKLYHSKTVLSISQISKEASVRGANLNTPCVIYLAFCIIDLVYKRLLWLLDVYYNKPLATTWDVCIGSGNINIISFPELNRSLRHRTRLFGVRYIYDLYSLT